MGPRRAYASVVDGDDRAAVRDVPDADGASTARGITGHAGVRSFGPLPTASAARAPYTATGTRRTAPVACCATSDPATCAAATAVVHARHRTTPVAETKGQGSQDEREMEAHGYRWSNSWTKGGPATAAVVGPETLRNLMDGRGFLISVPWCRRRRTSTPMELRFVRTESAFDYFEATKSNLRKHGRPVAFYSDKHRIFRVAREGSRGRDKGITSSGALSLSCPSRSYAPTHRRPRVVSSA